MTRNGTVEGVCRVELDGELLGQTCPFTPMVEIPNSTLAWLLPRIASSAAHPPPFKL